MTIAQTNPPAVHASFRQLQDVAIDALKLRIQHFEHRETGAQHYHLASEHNENVFLVALRTVPEDSTGVAHILEHTALCGSQRYPVRDPFFMMLRRSLNTFMNAFTSADWTAYPFASQNRKDFDNLLDVYLDAVFFSTLDPMDFAQEGHRVEFAEPGNVESDLVFKGVVFNEMKGAMSSVSATLWQTLCEHLFPTSTYHYNSGGDPACIPDLSYEQLQAFYRSHYHPSNAIFMTFGDIPAIQHQAVFEDRALRHFTRSDAHIAVSPEQRLTAPQRIHSSYAFDEDSPCAEKTHIVVGWMLGESTDLEQLLEAQLLNAVLMENSASPLQHALETSSLGSAPSPLCGLEDSMREMVFCCGIEGAEADRTEALETLVLDVIGRVASDGVSEDHLKAVLHQLELHQREVGGDGFPYGLSLILQALGCATHHADPIPLLDLEPVIVSLREKIKDPNYIRGLAQRLLLDNPHRITLVMSPDPALSAQRAASERQRLAAIKAGLDESGRQAIVDRAAELQARQQTTVDASVLPKVTLADVPDNLAQIPYREHRDSTFDITTYEQGTNGLVYQQLVAPLPALDDAELQILGHYTGMATELGIGGDSYLDTQHRQSACVGSIRLSATLRGSVDDEQVIAGNMVLSSKALLRQSGEQLALMRDTRETLAFDELPRLRELVSQQRARREQSITGSGHSLAMAAACAGMSPLARQQHRASGLEGIRELRALDERLRNDSELQAFAAELSALHAKLHSNRPELLSIAEPGSSDELVAQARKALTGLSHGACDTGLTLPALRDRRSECWITNTQVNFCAKAYPTVPVGHADAAALTVLGGFLRNGFLHRAIREQGGAYGGGASQDSTVAAFRFFSYRDPRLAETLQDFDESVTWLLAGTHDPSGVEEAILGVISGLDKPASPAGEAKQDFHNRRFGRDHAQRMLFRQRVLAVTQDDLQRVAQCYLLPERASIAVVTGAAQRDASASLRQEMGLILCEL